MHATIITAAVTLAAPQTLAPPSGFNPAYVEVTPGAPEWKSSGGVLQALARDEDGEIVANMAIWSASDGLHVGANYGDTDGDGESEYSEIVFADGEVASVTAVGATVAELTARAELLASAMGQAVYVGPAEPYGGFECIGGAATAVPACVAASVVCPIAMTLAACACIPLLPGADPNVGCP